ncbi:MAG: GNAT family N-acetyltransferase [Ectothiorhodospiraceae bacterium]|nr:GNAT family N-acetyltransferase [Chromatiales bacterium]MCP5154731.1 GNAT family N-acetyltransferase [Ectothiorhodospiraceae bacterium]
MDEKEAKIRALRPRAEASGQARARPRAPRGHLEVVITYLEMRAPPSPRGVSPHRAEKLALMRAERPTVSFYRYLYNTVGAPWLWYERRKMDDDRLRANIQDPAVEITVLHVGGVPAGYVEIDRREPAEVELAYFGLVPEFIGRGLGTYLLEWAITQAWSSEPQRVWVNTCTLDHPKALAVYQRAGFVPYHQETVVIRDPRGRGVMPRGMEFPPGVGP